MERLKRVQPDEMPEVLRLASELYAQDRAQIERAQECEQIGAAAAEAGLPPEYLERAAAALEARRRTASRPRHGRRTLLAAVALALALWAGWSAMPRWIPSPPVPPAAVVQPTPGEVYWARRSPAPTWPARTWRARTCREPTSPTRICKGPTCQAPTCLALTSPAPD